MNACLRDFSFRLTDLRRGWQRLGAGGRYFIRSGDRATGDDGISTFTEARPSCTSGMKGSSPLRGLCRPLQIFTQIYESPTYLDSAPLSGQDLLQSTYVQLQLATQKITCLNERIDGGPRALCACQLALASANDRVNDLNVKMVDEMKGLANTDILLRQEFGRACKANESFCARDVDFEAFLNSMAELAMPPQSLAGGQQYSTLP